jgi:hypothetical protein
MASPRRAGLTLPKHCQAGAPRGRQTLEQSMKEKSTPDLHSGALGLKPGAGSASVRSAFLKFCGPHAVHLTAFGQSIQSDCIHASISRHVRNDHLIPYVKAL